MMSVGQYLKRSEPPITVKVVFWRLLRLLFALLNLCALIEFLESCLLYCVAFVSISAFADWPLADNAPSVGLQSEASQFWKTRIKKLAQSDVRWFGLKWTRLASCGWRDDDDDELRAK